MIRRAVIAFLLLISLSCQSFAASYFWVAIAGVGTGTWNNVLTTNWATSSGGTPGAGPPTSSDTATFDANSGTGTVTIASTAATSALAFGAANITTAFSGGVTFGTVTVTAGTFVTGANTHSFTSLTSTSGTRTLTLTGSTINITGTSGTPWNVSTAGTLTFTAASSTINFTGGGAGTSLTQTFGALTYGTISTTGAGLWTAGGALTASSFSYTSTTNKTDSYSLSSNITIAAAGSLTISGNSTVNRAFVKSNALGTQRTISVPSGATVSLTNVDFQDIASAGTFGTWTGTSFGDALGNSGITFDPSVSLTLASTGTINWSTATWAGTTNRVPLPQDDVSLGSSSTATTLGIDVPRMGRNIDASQYLKTLSFNFVSSDGNGSAFYGNWKFGSGMTASGVQPVNAQGRGAQTITCAGKGFPGILVINAFGGSYTAQDTFGNSGTSGLDVQLGTFADGGNIVNLDILRANGNVSHGISGSGVWNMWRTSGSPWAPNYAGFTVSGTIEIRYAGIISGTASFSGSNTVSYYKLNFYNPASTGTLIITGANTFNDFKIDGTTARTVQFPASTTQTVSSFTASGADASHKISLTSSSPGTPATLSKSSGYVSSDYLSITDSTATGGALWFAGNHSTSGGGNSGWRFYGLGGGGLPTLGVGSGG